MSGVERQLEALKGLAKADGARMGVIDMALLIQRNAAELAANARRFYNSGNPVQALILQEASAEASERARRSYLVLCKLEEL